MFNISQALQLRPSTINRLISISELLLRAGVILVPVICLVGAFLMTAGTDETWILFGARGLVEHGSYAAESPVNSVLSTGGLYTILVSLLHIVGSGQIEVIRILSVVSIAALLFTLHLWAIRVDIPSPHRWLVTAAPLLVPGTFMLGAQAYGTILAVLLLVIGLMLWGELESGTGRRRLLIALLLGTAAATRQEVVFALVAPLFVVLLTRSNRTHFIDSVLVLIIGGFVFLFQYFLLETISVNLFSNPESSGLGNPFSDPLAYLIPKRLAFWSISQSFMPFVLAMLISLGWYRARLSVKKPYGLDALLVFAWLAVLAWLVMGPIPHLRYIWPALAAFATVGMFTLALLLNASRLHVGNVIALGFALLVTGYLDGARTFLHGESDILSWQLSRETNYSLEYGPFRHLQYQKAMVNRLLQIPADEPIATLGFTTSLSYLTRRNIVPVQTYYPDEKELNFVMWRPAILSPPIRPHWIVLTPMINHYKNAHISNQLYEWIKSNCRVADRQGPYVLYEVTGTFPEKMDIFSHKHWAESSP